PRLVALLGAAVSRLLAFGTNMLGLIFFKSAGVKAAFALISIMAARRGAYLAGGLIHAREGFAWILAGFVIVWCFPNTQEIMHRFRPALNMREFGARSRMILKYKWLAWSPNAAWASLTVALEILAVVSLSKSSEFIYYQF